MCSWKSLMPFQVKAAGGESRIPNNWNRNLHCCSCKAEEEEAEAKEHALANVEASKHRRAGE